MPNNSTVEQYRFEHTCPHCNKVMDGITSVEESARPKPDDATICLYCARSSIFQEDMTLRKPTLEEDTVISNTTGGQIAFAVVVKHLARKIVLAVEFNNGQLLVFNADGEQMPVFQGDAETFKPRLRAAGYKGEIQGPLPWPY